MNSSNRRHAWTRFVALAWFGLLSLSSADRARADVKLPAIFSDHMVLQRDTSVPVWGWADPEEMVSVSIAGQTQSAKAGADGRWMVKLDKLKTAGGGQMLTVQGKNKLTVNDVLMGEVWLGSGQSNMAMTVNRALDFPAEQAAADLPTIRMFVVARKAANTPQTDCAGEWLVCTPANLGKFSATAYFFGREIHKALGVPVGLINSSVGGTPIESWISPDVQQSSAELKSFFQAQRDADAAFEASRAAVQARFEKDLARWTQLAAKAKAAGETPPPKPQNPIEVRQRKGDVGGLFNGMIHPLVPFALRGVLWYQGEANSAPQKAPFYRHQLPMLVNNWRHRFGQGDLPFAWVQLPNFDGAGRDWPIVREAMLDTLSLPNTGMAVAIDIGEAKDIHPRNKQDVGKRLALWALATVYGKDVPASGPLPAGHKVEQDKVVVTFKHAHGGLKSRDGDLKGFEIAGSDDTWRPAQARIDGDRVIVSSPDVAKPVAARYGWSNNPQVNLINGAGLPASPFRTQR